MSGPVMCRRLVAQVRAVELKLKALLCETIREAAALVPIEVTPMEGAT